MVDSVKHQCEFCGNTKQNSDISFQDQVTSWLNNNPEFTFNYFVNHATPCLVEAWSNARIKRDAQNVFDNVNALIDDVRIKNNPDVRSRTSVSSIRSQRINSKEFDADPNDRIVKANEDGKPTFINFNHFKQPSTTSPKEASGFSTRASSIQTSKVSDCTGERDLINELILDICNELDVSALCFKIIQNVCILVRADRGSLFLVQKDPISNENVLVSKLFDVTTECNFDDISAKCSSKRIVIPMGVGITGHVAMTGEYANIADAYADPRFNSSVDRETGYKTNCILCMPIKDASGDVLAVALIINKKSNMKSDVTVHDPFTKEDVRIFQSYVAFCGIGLYNAQIYQHSRMEAYRNQVLLELARIIFTEQSDITSLIHTVLSHTNCLLKCQRCQLLLVKSSSETDTPGSFRQTSSTQHYSDIYELSWNDSLSLTEFCKHKQCFNQTRFPVHFELANEVLQTGEPINIANVESDDRFDHHLESDLETSICKTNSILCMPIKRADNKVLAICLITNKSVIAWQDTADPFTRFDGYALQSTTVCEPDWSGVFSSSDQFLFEAFALFIGLGISNSQMHIQTMRDAAKQRIILDVLSYHATAPTSEAKILANSLIPTANFYRLDQFSFSDIKLSDEDTLKACIRMFNEMKFMKSIKIDQLAFARWLLSVRKNYREVTYHNWRHAFNVTQTMFCLIMHGNFQTVFTDLECLALLTACLSHDIDHRGTDNQFQIKTMSPLSELYSTSVLEHHHFNQCMMILTVKGNNFLHNLSKSDYDEVVLLIRKAILATDLSRYFKRLPQFKQTLETRLKQKDSTMSLWIDNRDERILLSHMFMTACDVSAITKPWPVQKIAAELVASEFFEQGDLEKEQFNVVPSPLMDREKKNELPHLQVNFIDTICLPVYEAICKVSPAFTPLLEGCQRNKSCWLKVAQNETVPQTLYGLDCAEQNQTSMRSSRLNLNSTDSMSVSPHRGALAQVTTVGGRVVALGSYKRKEKD